MSRRALEELVAILRLAYSGELAAAHAYRGHRRSVRDMDTRARIQRIEEDEWHHRALVGRMLVALGRRPSRAREVRASLVGRTLGILCHVSGWLLPMYGAGRLESRNVRVYELAARHAATSGHDELVDCLLAMAEVEWDHEAYFRSCVLGHRWASKLPLWQAPGRREDIRESFTRDLPGDGRIHPRSRTFAYEDRGA